MTVQPAKRLDNVKFSPVRRVLEKANAMEAEGRSVIHFEIGEPDFDTPDIIVRKTIKALQDKKTHYSPNRGELSLRVQIAKYLKDRCGITADPKEEILVTVGAAESIFASIAAFVNEGDEVIVLTPSFMFYENTVKMMGGKFVEIPLKPENGFQVDVAEVEKALSPKTKMIIINNPLNPAGVIFPKDSLMALGELAVRNDILLVTDEIYCEIVYDGEKCFSPASVAKFKDHVITINGFSKAYAMTGWRLGYVVAGKEHINAMLKVHQYSTTCLPTFIQLGAAEAMNAPECLAEVEKMRGVFEKRRNILMEKLAEIPGVSFVPTKGAFYLLVNISRFGMSDEDFADELIGEQGVAVVPASGFAASFKGHIRISYATSEENIREGMKRLKAFCASRTYAS